MALRDRAPESDFHGEFSDTETKLDEGNTAISRYFERGPIPYALEVTGRLGRQDSNLCISESEFAKSIGISRAVRFSTR